MQNTHRSAGSAVIAVGIAVLVLLAGFFVVAALRQRTERATPTPPSPPAGEKVMEEKPSETMVKKDEGGMMEQEGDAMKKKESETMMEKGQSMMTYSGTVLAGTSSPLIDFNSIDYEAANATDKLIVLYFYANWCPICREEVPQLQAAFSALTTDQVIGFRVNYNDTDTDDAERALAREHGVGYQHTKVFVRQRQRVLKSPETWTKDRYVAEIQAHAPAPAP